MRLITVQARDIPDAWFQCIWYISEYSRKYTIDRGSYEGESRLQFDNITIEIKHPYAEPYDLMLPDIPAELGIPNPVEPGYVEQYLPYLMTNHVEPGEQYTYGERISEQVNYWIKVLQVQPNTNQAILQVGQPNDYKLTDPPCLRHIDMMVLESYIPYIDSYQPQLVFYPYFRSWDLWGGMPANLAGIAVLQHHMAGEIGVDPGPIIASSKGLHIYGYVEELAKLRCYKEG